MWGLLAGRICLDGIGKSIQYPQTNILVSGFVGPKMSNFFRFAVVPCVSCALMIGCQATNYTQRGASMGGLGGAGLGAIIGELAADEPLAGAAIGGAVGALSGGAIGSGVDEIDALNRSRVQQAAYQQASATATLNEIVSMSDAGLSDEIISRHIRSNGYAGPLDAGDLIALRRQGVSDLVISDLQASASVPAVRVATRERIPEPTVIVEERYHTVPVFGPPRYHRGPICRPRGRPGLHWGVAFGH